MAPRSYAAAYRPLLAPRSIAIVGASESSSSWAPDIYESIRHMGFTGEILPVNPKYDEVWGLRCYHSPADLPKGVDLAVMVVPANVAVALTEECADAGVRSVMVISSGFAEIGAEGKELQDRLAAIADEHGIPVLGPNVEGFVNYVDKVAPYGTLPPLHPVAGGISVISQSGTVAWAMTQQASDRGVGLRIVLGVGNEAVVGLGDMFSWAAEDPATKIVCTYIETLRDVDGIGRGLDALAAANKPILVCAPEGKSEAALRAIIAHTGALAGNTTFRDAWLRGHGAVLVDDPVTMFEAAVLLAASKKVRAPGVAGAFQSGGACTLFAEAAGAQGLDLPAFTQATVTALKRALPHYASQNNPLDVTGQAAVETSMYEKALTALAKDPGIGVVLFDAFAPRGDDHANADWAVPVLQKARELQKETGVVFAPVTMTPLTYGEAAPPFIARAKLPFLQGHRAAAGAVRALIDLQERRSRAVPKLAPHANAAAARGSLKKRPAGPLDEADGALLLAAYGIRRPKEATVERPAAAADVARRIGFPVVVKALAPEIPHKAKLGGVRLDLMTVDEVRTAAEEVLVAAKDAGAKAPQVLVQQQVSGHEVLIGAVIDEQFGVCVTLRPGGALAEVGEAAFVAGPLTPRQARAYVVARSDACGLTDDAHDLAAVAKAVEGIARAAHDLREHLASLEANPLLVMPKGAIAVDALAEVRG